MHRTRISRHVRASLAATVSPGHRTLRPSHYITCWLVLVNLVAFMEKKVFLIKSFNITRVLHGSAVLLSYVQAEWVFNLRFGFNPYRFIWFEIKEKVQGRRRNQVCTFRFFCVKIYPQELKNRWFRREPLLPMFNLDFTFHLWINLIKIIMYHDYEMKAAFLTCGAGSGWQFAIRAVSCEGWRHPSAGITVVLLHGSAVFLCVFTGRSYYVRQSIYRQWSGAGAGLNHHQLLWHRRVNLRLINLSDV